MDEVVEHIDVAHRIRDGIRVLRVAGDNLDTVSPGEGGDALRMPGEDAHAVSRAQQPRHEASAEVPGGAEHERSRLLAARTRLCDESGFASRGSGEVIHTGRLSRP